MNVLMYHRTAAVSGPRLAQWMGLHSTRSLEGERNRPTTLIRYGTSKRIPLRPSQLTLNTAASLSRYSNRGEQLRLLRDGGVPVPPFTTRGGMETMARQGGLPLLARKYPRNRQPTRGQGITFVPPGENAPEDFDLLLQFIPKDRQFRVHVIGGRTRVREVIPTEPGLREQPVWNLGEGFIYHIPQTPPPPTVVPAAAAAVAALRLDFGAVDVITRGDTAWVLEVNTAPGLSDPSLEWYGTQLGRLIGLSPDDMPRWDAVPATHDGGTLA